MSKLVKVATESAGVWTGLALSLALGCGAEASSEMDDEGETQDESTSSEPSESGTEGESEGETGNDTDADPPSGCDCEDCPEPGETMWTVELSDDVQSSVFMNDITLDEEGQPAVLMSLDSVPRVVQLDAEGDELWTWEDPVAGALLPTLDRTAAGGVIGGGRHGEDDDEHAYAFRLDAQGELEWEWDAPSEWGRTLVRDIGVTDGGDAIVQVRSFPTMGMVRLLRLGQSEWELEFDGEYGRNAGAIAVGEPSIVMTSSEANMQGMSEIHHLDEIALDGSDIRAIDISEFPADLQYLGSVARTPEGGIAVTGERQADEFSSSYAWLGVLSADDELLWERSMSEEHLESPRGLAVDHEGNVLWSGGFLWEGWIAKQAPDSSRVWLRGIEDYGLDYDTSFPALAVDSCGDVLFLEFGFTDRGAIRKIRG